MTFGDKAIAQAAADTHRDHRNYPDGEVNGFKFLGNGCSRTAWLHMATQVVYKVLYYPSDKDNHNELEASVLLRKFVWEAVYIPKMEAYETTQGLVLAVEFIDAPLGQATPKGSHMKGRQELLHKGRFSDMHGMNFLITADGISVPIDMGHPRREEGDWQPDPRVLKCGDGNWGY